MKLLPLFTAGLLGATLATSAFAAGSSTPTTSKDCKNGQVFDEKKEKCVDPQRGMFTDDFIYKAAVQMAYDREYTHAITLLNMAADPNDPRILNYLGFSYRKMGDTKTAMTYYKRALAIDPNYNLARSYMAQGMVADGDLAGAKVQLAEIAQRGGQNTWAYVMLENAITSGTTY